MPEGRAPLSMNIGTPLSPAATKVMLLGSGELGKEVVIALQRLGVEVVAVDRYANAPGHQVAHRAHVIAMTDGPALRRLIEQERPHLVVPETRGDRHRGARSTSSATASRRSFRPRVPCSSR